MNRHIPISNLGWRCHEGGRGRTGPDGLSEYWVLHQLRLISLKALNGFVCPPRSTLGVCDEYRDKEIRLSAGIWRSHRVPTGRLYSKQWPQKQAQDAKAKNKFR